MACNMETYTGVLLEFMQEVLGRNKVVQEVAKAVVLISRLQDWKDLHGNVTSGWETSTVKVWDVSKTRDGRAKTSQRLHRWFGPPACFSCQFLTIKYAQARPAHYFSLSLSASLTAADWIVRRALHRMRGRICHSPSSQRGKSPWQVHFSPRYSNPAGFSLRHKTKVNREPEWKVDEWKHSTISISNTRMELWALQWPWSECMRRWPWCRQRSRRVELRWLQYSDQMVWFFSSTTFH